MTKEEYLAKMKANQEKVEEKCKETYLRNKEKLINQVIGKITELIENADSQQRYEFSKEETEELSYSDLFKEKLEELRKKYDFLEFRVNGYPNFPDDIFEIYEIRWGMIGMKDYILTETGKVIPTNGGKVIIEDGYVYMMSLSTSKMTKEKIIAESDDPEEFRKVDCKLIFCPSNPPKLTENERGILRRINPKLEEKPKPMKRRVKHDQTIVSKKDST